jgi:hypothetical protein
MEQGDGVAWLFVDEVGDRLRWVGGELVVLGVVADPDDMVLHLGQDLQRLRGDAEVGWSEICTVESNQVVERVVQHGHLISHCCLAFCCKCHGNVLVVPAKTTF